MEGRGDADVGWLVWGGWGWSSNLMEDKGTVVENHWKTMTSQQTIFKHVVSTFFIF
jgi:hypothetical protein